MSFVIGIAKGNDVCLVADTYLTNAKGDTQTVPKIIPMSDTVAIGISGNYNVGLKAIIALKSEFSMSWDAPKICEELKECVLQVLNSTPKERAISSDCVFMIASSATNHPPISAVSLVAGKVQVFQATQTLKDLRYLIFPPVDLSFYNCDKVVRALLATRLSQSALQSAKAAAYSVCNLSDFVKAPLVYWTPQVSDLQLDIFPGEIRTRLAQPPKP